MAQESYLGEIRHFAFGFAPKNWAQCNGQTLPINQNQALYGVIGVTFGGNGTTTFALPNLQGVVPLSTGTLAGGQNYAYAQAGGSPSVQLTISQMPAHTHGAKGSGSAVSTNAPSSSVLPGTFPGTTNYSDSVAGQVPMGGSMVGNTGNGVAHENRQPYLALNVCICVVGAFPPRN